MSKSLPGQSKPQRMFGDFHAQQGWYFRRTEDGGVRILHADPLVAEGDGDSVVTLDAAAWASVVAHVSAGGESAATWRAALDFHNQP